MTPNANSTMLVRPTMTAPAARSRATAAASRCAGRRVGEDLRSGARHVAADVEQILHRDRQTFDRRSHDAGAAQPVGMIGFGARGVGVDLRERARPFAGWVSDSRERAFDAFATRHVVRSRRVGVAHRSQPVLRKPLEMPAIVTFNARAVASSGALR